MATTVERHVHHDREDDGSSALTAVVAVVAVVLLLGLLLFMAGTFPFGGTARTDDTDINVDLPAVVDPFGSPEGNEAN